MKPFEQWLMGQAPWEQCTFCYHCGGMLMWGLGTPRPNAPSSSTAACVECGTEWDRLYTHDCPGCAAEHGGQGWLHLFAPNNWRVGERYVEEASGAGWCDACALNYLYDWSRNGGVPGIWVRGWDRTGGAVDLRGSTREMVRNTS